MHAAFIADPTLTYQRLAELVAAQIPGSRPPSQTTLKRIVDPSDPKKVSSSSILWAVKNALGIPPDDNYRVTFNRDEIAVLDSWRLIAQVNSTAASKILADLRERAESAKASIEAAKDAAKGLDLSTPEHKTHAPG